MRRITLPVVVLLAVFVSGLRTAGAQGTDWTADGSFSVQLFEPAPGPDNFINVEGTRIGSEFSITAGLLLNYQYQPFVLFGCASGTGGEGQPACELQDEPLAKIIEHQLGGDLLFSVSFLKLFTVGLAVPVVMYQTGSTLDVDSATPAGDIPALGGIGDLRLHLKFRLYPFMEGDKEGFSIALAPIISAPIGQFFDSDPPEGEERTGSFLGSGMVTAWARLILDYTDGPFHVAGQVAYHWREDTAFYDRTIGHELAYGAAFGWKIIPDLELIAEVSGRNGFSLRVDQSPLEADLALRYRLGPVLLMAGGGTGLPLTSDFARGIGAPIARAFLGVSYQPFEEVEEVVDSPDRDLDGFLNEEDGCPDAAEDLDNYQDADGCPDPDNDGDTVLDVFDACVDVPEDLDGFEDEDGCPDNDHDKDGIDVPADQCPDNPEDFDGFEDEDGCPEPDNDRDTLTDDVDVCPDDPEDFDGFNDDDGCSDPDNDQDGVPDATDECPDEPETLNGTRDEDGCPDRGQTLVEVTGDQIRIRQQVNFETDSDRIKGRKSFEILDVVATVLRINPQLRVEVQGHTDNRGGYEHNIDLSQRRAEAVVAYLVEKGVEASRLRARGYGPDVPIEDNGSSSGRAANRRVEFHILRADGSVDGQDMPATTEEPAPPAEGTEAAPPAEGSDTMNF